MNREELIELLLIRFYENFAEEMADRVLSAGGLDVLYTLATTAGNGENLLECSTADRDKVRFRAAYVLEKIYFRDRALFAPYRPSFYRDFATIGNSSAQRHFGKIMADLLARNTPNEQPDETCCGEIAEACVCWITEPRVRVAVQIWAMNTLLLLRPRLPWISELLPELMETLRRNPTPAMQVSLRRWCKRIG